MMANHSYVACNVAKAIADMGFYEFRRQLDYKCELYGSQLIIVDRWFPSSKTCSRCGQVKQSLPLSERIIKLRTLQFQLRTRLKCSVKFSYGGQ
uniref:zinc ribbon domain-containing protein n=1 Tax=Okeania sp. SIO2F4 TaxID=2607790 RepID=UPI0025FC13A6|nr:zinc ribbon domain-containing protein [Okeania sp. SIO2F4]